MYHSRPRTYEINDGQDGYYSHVYRQPRSTQKQTQRTPQARRDSESLSSRSDEEDRHSSRRSSRRSNSDRSSSAGAARRGPRETKEKLKHSYGDLFTDSSAGLAAGAVGTVVGGWVAEKLQDKQMKDKRGNSSAVLTLTGAALGGL